MIEAVLVSAGRTYPDEIASVSWNEIDVPTVSGADVVHVNTPAAIAQSASDSEATVPAGIGSLTTTPAGSTDGPLLVSVIVYVVDVPASIAGHRRSWRSRGRPTT